MDCGYVGSCEEEVMEFPDDIIEEELELWFWDNFGGGYNWEEVAKDEEE